jgi:cell fate regulator YaaT (PSP1 superfamily)
LSNLNELGKGVPLHSVPSSYPLFIVEFKAGRTDLYYLPSEAKFDVRVGDLVIVEADRGRDLGKVVNEGITVREVDAWQRQQAERAQAQAQAIVAGMSGVGMDGQPTSPVQMSAKKEISPKMICGKAGPQDTQMLANKTQDEHKALQLCQSKVRAKKLPMEVIDAEYQWDRRKLTFYFVADKRIDFRELVRELFRLYKTRIWMASLQGPGGYEQ